MKRSTKLTLVALALAGVVGAVAIPVLAGGGPAHFGGMMGGPGMMMGRGDPAMMMQGGPGAMAGVAGAMHQTFDANGDGTLTADEIEAGMAGMVKKYDTDADGSLSSTEFDGLVAEMTKGIAEARFAALDANGDQKISADELKSPMGAGPQYGHRGPMWQRH